jgi:hypothetical protein
MKEVRKLATSFSLFSRYARLFENGWYEKAISDAKKQPIREGFFKLASFSIMMYNVGEF